MLQHNVQKGWGRSFPLFFVGIVFFALFYLSTNIFADSNKVSFEVSYVNVANVEDQVSLLKERIGGGFDDIFVMIPVNSVVSDAAAMLNPDGCLNFFAGPQDKEFSANINFYDVHYSFTHFVGTSGGNTEDMRKAVKLIEDKQVTVANIVTHILGLDAVGETTLNQPAIGGGKKLVYTHKQAQLTKLT
ncbi:zinc-binding dehydrogenase, partial [Enterococcus faecium]|uniref:zinc-binding dehydrogenase n=1 Tax=Enterococcus faecium TaxID=1352 RepID=UPI002B4BF738